MRVLLVFPPMTFEFFKYAPKGVYEAAYYPPLQLLCLAAAVRERNPECQIRIVDFLDFGGDVNSIAGVLREYQPDIVGITANTPTLNNVIYVAREAKKQNPKTHVCIGGLHLLLYPEESIRYEEIDSIVIGDGERPFSEIVNRIDEGANLAGIDGVWFKEHGDVIRNSGQQPADLDLYPFPARDLLSGQHKYTVGTDSDIRATSMATGRGCPYQCIFCNNPDPHYRHRSVENIIEEMELCRRQGYQLVNIIDETFNVDLKHCKALCDAMIEADLGLEWSFRGRVDNFDEEFAEKLSRSRCIRANLGIESGSDKILNNIGKGITTTDVRRAFGLAKKYDIATVSYFILGFPEETDDEIRQSIRLALESGSTYIQVLLLMIPPKTKLYYQALREGVISEDYYSTYLKDPLQHKELAIWLKEKSEDELLRWQRKFYRRFYLRPSYLWARLREISSWSELHKKLKMGLFVIFYALFPKKLDN